jgi:hypothetical protein
MRLAVSLILLGLHLVDANFLFPRATTAKSGTATVSSTTASTTVNPGVGALFIGLSSLPGTWSQTNCDAQYQFRNFANATTYDVGACCIPKTVCNPVIACTSGSVAVLKNLQLSTW